VYCAPGKLNLQESELPLHHLIWTTKDGKQRKKEVLNDAGDKITLIDGNSVEVRVAMNRGHGLIA